jgi:hypothetical protein
LGGNVTSDPVLAQRRTDPLQLFVRGPNNEVLFESQNPDGIWPDSPFRFLKFTSDAILSRNSNGLLELFMVGESNT